MRFIAVLLLLISLPAFGANTVSEVCASSPDNRYALGACPRDSAGATLGSPTTTGVSVTGLPSGIWHVLLKPASTPGVCDEYTDANRRRLFSDILSSGNGVSTAASNTVTVDWGTTGLTDQCLYLFDYSKATVGNVTGYGPFDTLSGGAVAHNWNPGIYLADKVSNMLDSSGNWKPASQYYTTGRMAILCGAGDTIFKGHSMRIEWAEAEPFLNDREAFHDMLTDHRRYLREDCGTVPKSWALMLDAQANKRDAREGLAVPADWRTFGPDGHATTNAFAYAWENDGGVERLAARIWNNPTVRDAYVDLALDILARHGQDRYMEAFSFKGEGAWINNASVGPANFNPNTAYATLVSMAQQAKAFAPRVPVLLGTNNFLSGQRERIYTEYRPAVTSTSGMGIRWPDTYAESAPGPRGNVLTTSHGAYYHMFQNQIMMWGDWQFATSRYGSFNDVLRQSVDATLVPVNPPAPDADFINPADGSEGFTPATRMYGSTHQAIQVTFSGTNPPFPISDLIALVNGTYGGVVPQFDASCPDAWDVCENNQGVVIP